jgi:hypothetical protein
LRYTNVNSGLAALIDFHAWSASRGNGLFYEKHTLVFSKATEEVLGALINKSPPKMRQANQIFGHSCLRFTEIHDGLLLS